MKTLNVNLFNEKFDTNYEGDEIGYGERGLIFQELTDFECNGFEDFCENAEIGQCYTYDGVTYYKVNNENGDAIIFFVDDDEKIRVL